MIGISPSSIFPLRYPKGDPTLPASGAFAIPVSLDWSQDNAYSIDLNNIQQQKPFGSLRCIWIDASAVAQTVTVGVNGTEQVFTVQPGQADYFPVLNMNVPLVEFSLANKEASLLRIILLNFCPAFPMPRGLL